MMTTIEHIDSVAIAALTREKVHAINHEYLHHLKNQFDELRQNDEVRSIIFTGEGSFFSFGFDLPELLTYDHEAMLSFLTDLNSLKLSLFTFPKPIIAALNGHTLAGGCMLALTCDQRIAVASRMKMGLNEINLGVPVFASTIAMLNYWVGSKNSQDILLSGQLYSVDEATKLGLIDTIVERDSLLEIAIKEAELAGSKPQPAYQLLKNQLRKDAVAHIERNEEKSIETFLDVWFEPATQEILRTVEIRK